MNVIKIKDFLLVGGSPFKCDDGIGSRLLTISWSLTYLFMLLVSLMLGVYFPVSILFSDVCAVAYEVPQDFERFFVFFGLKNASNTTRFSEYEDTNPSTEMLPDLPTEFLPFVPVPMVHRS